MEKINSELTMIINESLDRSMSYSEYRDLVSKHVLASTSSGPNQTEDLSEYTKLNATRMKRLGKTIKLPEAASDKFKNYKRNVTWLVLTESWCGDAAQSIPIMNTISELSDSINLRLVLRDENLDLMNEFLTNGSQSIPKLIVIDNDSQAVLKDWGPRPSIATKMVNDYKTEHASLTPEFKKDLQIWYTKDKGLNIIEDLEKLLIN